MSFLWIRMLWLLLLVPAAAEPGKRGMGAVHEIAQLGERLPQQEGSIVRRRDLAEPAVEEAIGLPRTGCAAE